MIKQNFTLLFTILLFSAGHGRAMEPWEAGNKYTLTRLMKLAPPAVTGPLGIYVQQHANEMWQIKLDMPKDKVPQQASRVMLLRSLRPFALKKGDKLNIAFKLEVISGNVQFAVYNDGKFQQTLSRVYSHEKLSNEHLEAKIEKDMNKVTIVLTAIVNTDSRIAECRVDIVKGIEYSPENSATCKK
jgi:hypothetical protein